MLRKALHYETYCSILVFSLAVPHKRSKVKKWYNEIFQSSVNKLSSPYGKCVNRGETFKPYFYDGDYVVAVRV